MTGILSSPNFPAMAGWFLGLIWPLAGLFALWYGQRRKPRFWRVVQPLLWLATLLGPLTVGLWFAFNAIVNRFGLDSVFGLVANLVFFCLVGLVVGFAARLTVGNSRPQ